MQVVHSTHTFQRRLPLLSVCLKLCNHFFLKFPGLASLSENFLPERGSRRSSPRRAELSRGLKGFSDRKGLSVLKDELRGFFGVSELRDELRSLGLSELGDELRCLRGESELGNVRSLGDLSELGYDLRGLNGLSALGDDLCGFSDIKGFSSTRS